MHVNDPQRHQDTLDSIRNADANQLNEYASMCFAAGHPGPEAEAAEPPQTPARVPTRPAPARSPAAPPASAPAP